MSLKELQGPDRAPRVVVWHSSAPSRFCPPLAGALLEFYQLWSGARAFMCQKAGLRGYGRQGSEKKGEAPHLDPFSCPCSTSPPSYLFSPLASYSSLSLLTFAAMLACLYLPHARKPQYECFRACFHPLSFSSRFLTLFGTYSLPMCATLHPFRFRTRLIVHMLLCICGFRPFSCFGAVRHSHNVQALASQENLP